MSAVAESQAVHLRPGGAAKERRLLALLVKSGLSDADPGLRGVVQDAQLLVSLDLDEILDVADRILVLFKGKVAGQMPRADATEDRVGRLLLGQAG